MAGHNKQHGLGSGADHSSATIAELNALVSDGSLISQLSNTIYVSKEGNDANDGTVENPFLTIKAANDSITDNSAINPYTIMVAAGIYTESAIVMKVYVDIRAIGGPYTTSVVASAVGNTIFTSTGYNTLAGFGVTGATSGKGFLMATAAVPSCIVKDCVFYNCAVGVECTAGSVIILSLTTAPVGSMTNLVYANGGEIRGQGLVIPASASITNLFNSDGVGSYIDWVTIESESSSVTTGLLANNGGKIRARAGEIEDVTNGAYALGTASSIQLQAFKLDGCTNGIRIAGTAQVDALACIIADSTTWDLLVEATGATIHMVGCAMDRSKVSFPTGYANDICLFQDDREGDQGVVNWGEFAVGRTERGTESVFGEGDSYVRGMVVITTDGTATSTTDGGNLTDVSVTAASASGSTFSFQGVTANHTIIVGSSLQNATDMLKHWGIKISQTTRAVEVTKKSFVFEYWNGTAWTSFKVMATSSSLFHRYANEVFIRANSSEHIRYGLTQDITGTDWAKKTISGKNQYWIRIRISTTVTTAPVFEQFKLSTNRFEANADGTNTFHGRSRFRKTLAASGNVFGERGVVTALSLNVGSGTPPPTGWTHLWKNVQLDSVGDGLYYQLTIPRGIDTSLPIYFEVIVVNDATGTGKGMIAVLDFKPNEVQGVLEADPAGGITPVARTLANTEATNVTAAQTKSLTLNDTNLQKPQLLKYGPFDISNYYEGDFMFVLFQLTNDGTGADDLSVMELALSGVNWNHGGKL